MIQFIRKKKKFWIKIQQKQTFLCLLRDRWKIYIFLLLHIHLYKIFCDVHIYTWIYTETMQNWKYFFKQTILIKTNFFIVCKFFNKFGINVF